MQKSKLLQEFRKIGFVLQKKRLFNLKLCIWFMLFVLHCFGCAATGDHSTTAVIRTAGCKDVRPCRAWTLSKTSPTRSQKLRRSPGSKFNVVVSIATKIAPIRFGTPAPIHALASGQCRGEFTRAAGGAESTPGLLF